MNTWLISQGQQHIEADTLQSQNSWIDIVYSVYKMFFPLFSDIKRMCHCLSVLVIIIHTIIVLDHIYIIMYTLQIKLNLSMSNLTRILWLAHNGKVIYHKIVKTQYSLLKRPLCLVLLQAQVRSLFSSLDVQKASLDIIIANKLIKIAAEPQSKPLAYIQRVW